MADISTDWLDDEVETTEVSETDWNKYARLKITISKLEAEVKELQVKLLTQGDDWKHQTPYGTISAFKRSFVTYSPYAKEMIKEVQQRDVEEGRATTKETVIIKYTKPSNL